MNADAVDSGRDVSGARRLAGDVIAEEALHGVRQRAWLVALDGVAGAFDLGGPVRSA